MITKKNLLKCINSYKLSGANSIAKWFVKENVLTVKFLTIDKNLVGEINIDDVDMLDCEFGILPERINEFNKFVSAQGEELNVNIVFNQQNKPFQMEIVDEDGDGGSFNVGDGSQSENDKLVELLNKTIKLPTVYDVTMPITKSFIDKYILKKSGVESIDVVGISGGNNNLQFNFGYSIKKTSNDKLSFKYQLDGVTEFEPVSFEAMYLNDVLKANKEFDEATFNMTVGERSILVLEFIKDKCKATYIFPKLNIKKTNE